MSWDQQLRRAAARRATVTLVDGQRGTIVYAPHPAKDYTGKKRPRHGDPTKCGVRLSTTHPDWIAAVAPTEIIGIDPPSP